MNDPQIPPAGPNQHPHGANGPQGVPANANWTPPPNHGPNQPFPTGQPQGQFAGAAGPQLGFDQPPLAAPQEPAPAQGGKKKRRFARKDKAAAADATPPAGTDEHSARQNKWKKIRIGAISALIVVLFGGGVVLGWVANQVRQMLQLEPVSTAETVEIPISDIEAGTTMPDLRGMTKNDALSALSDAGVPTSKVEVSEKARAGIANVVIEQTPAPGEANLQDIQLVVSTAAKVPDVVGKDRNAAISEVRELGSEAEIKEEFRADAKPGTVLAISPKVGEPMGDSVSMTIAAAGSSVYLSTVNSIDNYCSSSAERLNAKEYPQSLVCNTDDEEGYSWEWDLQKRVAAVEMMVGISDSAQETGGSVTVIAYVDGKEVGRASATFGKPAKLSAPTAGGLRLKLVTVGTKASKDAWDTPKVVLGDPRLIGTADDMAVFGSED